MFWKTPKSHWSALEWIITLFFATIQFPEVELDEFSKNGIFFLEMLKKSQFEEEKQLFALKLLSQYAKKDFLFLAEICF